MEKGAGSAGTHVTIAMNNVQMLQTHLPHLLQDAHFMGAVNQQLNTPTGKP